MDDGTVRVSEAGRLDTEEGLIARVEGREGRKGSKRKLYVRRCGACDHQIHYVRGTKPTLCPYCQDEWWDKPKIEVELFHIQRDYDQSGMDKKHLARLFQALTRYARYLILGEIRGKYTLDRETLEEKANDAANGMIYYYLSKPTYRIYNSFAGYLIRQVKAVLYGEQDEEKNHDSLNAKLEDDHEFQDHLYKLGCRNPYDCVDTAALNDGIQVSDEILQLIDQCIVRIELNQGQASALRTLLIVKSRITGYTEAKLESLYRYCGQEAKKNSEIIMVLILRRLRSR